MKNKLESWLLLTEQKVWKQQKQLSFHKSNLKTVKLQATMLVMSLYLIFIVALQVEEPKDLTSLSADPLSLAALEPARGMQRPLLIDGTMQNTNNQCFDQSYKHECELTPCTNPQITGMQFCVFF